MIQLWVVALFAASGCAALIYEVVWFQLLQLVIGSSSTSVGILLATFMGGMCGGSLLLPRLGRPHWHPLKILAVLELVIGLSGLVLVFGLPHAGSFYASTGGHTGWRFALSMCALVVPTMAMGATLPAAGGLVGSGSTNAGRLGWLYTANLAGGVAGTLGAAFYFLPRHDLVMATFVAAGINGSVAAAAWGLARTVRPATSPTESQVAGRWPSPVLVVTALSGCTSLAAQVIWTRLLALLFGATVYTFALILAVFLTGLAMGSAVGTLVARRHGSLAPLALAWCQLLLAVCLVMATHWLDVMPFWPTAGDSRTETFRQDLGRASLVVGPAALMWGASFPLALSVAGSFVKNTGSLASVLYAANTIGAIIGALGTSALLIPLFGSHRAQQLIVVAASASGIVALIWARARGSNTPRPTKPVGLLSAEVAGVVVSAGLAIWSVLPIPEALIAYGRHTVKWAKAAAAAEPPEILFTGEGSQDFIAVSRGGNGALYYHAAGKVQASTVPEDMRLQLLLAHISHLFPEKPQNAIVIGCGAGITAGALSLGAGVERITIAEIEPLVPKVAEMFFGSFNHYVLKNPRVSLRIDDGRHVLRTTDETYDVITTDLIDPWVRGVATLFTTEFFELAKHRLRPGGVVTQFVQLYQSNLEAVQTEIATFLHVFPNAIIWGNPREGQGYDLVLLGQVEPIRIDVDALQARLELPANAASRRSLESIGFTNAVDLLSAYGGSGADLEEWLRLAAINHDRDLRLQYLAGHGLDMDASASIYRDILRRSRLSDDTFKGSADTLARLRLAHEERRAESLR